jgi:dihydropyrimidinase
VPNVVVLGGRAVLPTGIADVDIGISGGQFAAIEPPGQLAAATSVVDASGMVVIPGGIDPHVHINTQYGAWTTLDDFHTGTVPAAFGGTTSIIEFALPRPGETSLMALERRQEEAKSAAVVDYAFHACIAGHNLAESLSEILRFADKGVRSVKIFTTYRDTVGLTLDQLHELLKQTKASRTTVRLDLADRNFHVDRVAVEALAPGMKSFAAIPLSTNGRPRTTPEIASVTLDATCT